MSHILGVGTSVYAESARKVYRIEALIGSGGQGEVYRATSDGDEVALKWYYQETATASQEQLLRYLIERGAPSPKFLWPFDLVRHPDIFTFGYVMPLRPKHYRSFVDVMKRRIEPTFHTLITAGMLLADSFFQLHEQGFCHSDISLSNVFLDPVDGDIAVSDNDGVTIDRTLQSHVLGTPRFMAPEVVRGEAPPDVATDRFSLAVLLFYMLMMNHPLEGKRESLIPVLDMAAMNDLYGNNPIFIFDPNNDSNRPEKGYHDNALIYWRMYPQFLRDLFTKAFTEGLHDPQHGRVHESEWRAALTRLRDSIACCQYCGAENFWNRDAFAERMAILCWRCGVAFIPPFCITIGENEIVLNPGTRLFQHHIALEPTYEITDPIGIVTPRPNNAAVLGITNLSNSRWIAVTPSQATRFVDPGRTIRLGDGTRIQFGETDGIVRKLGS